MHEGRHRRPAVPHGQAAELTELAHHAAPGERARIERTIELAGRALLEVARARDVAERARRGREWVDTALVDRGGASWRPC